MDKISHNEMTVLEAAAFRRLVMHLRERGDVQNIDIMNLAGFCRNCLSNWMVDAAAERGIAMDKAASRELVYGMAYEDWQKLHQKQATPQQLATFETSKPQH